MHAQKDAATPTQRSYGKWEYYSLPVPSRILSGPTVKPGHSDSTLWNVGPLAIFNQQALTRFTLWSVEADIVSNQQAAIILVCIVLELYTVDLIRRLVTALNTCTISLSVRSPVTPTLLHTAVYLISAQELVGESLN